MTHDQGPAFDAPDGELGAMIRDVGPEPPSLVDVEVAVRQGERRIRRRRAISIAGIAVVTVLAVGATPIVLGAVSADHPGKRPAATASPSPSRKGPEPPTACTLTRLPEPAGTRQSYVTAADPTGRYVVATLYFKDGKERQAIWDNGRLHQVDIPGRNGDALFKDINSHGVAVGSSFISRDTYAAWIYRDGKVTQLAGHNAEAIAINDRGDVVGILHNGLTNAQPVMWRGGRGAPIPLVLPAGATSGTARDIADDGRIIGSVGDGSTGSAYLWLPDGGARKLPMPPGSLGGGGAVIRGDWVVGSGGQPLDEPGLTGHTPVTLRWNLRQNTVEILTAHYGFATINVQGWVAGDRGFGEPVLDTGTEPLKLPELGAERQTPGSRRSLVANVTDDGRTLSGHVHAKAGGMHAVVWRCA